MSSLYAESTAGTLPVSGWAGASSSALRFRDLVRMVKMAIVCGLLCGSVQSMATEPSGASKVTVGGESPAIVIDVRTPQEFADGHLVGAINIEPENIAGRIGQVTADKKARIELYCRSGRRSGVAQQILQQEGYTNTVNLGGFEALRATRPVTR